VRERKAAVDFRFRRIFRDEEIIKVFLRIYLVCVRVPEFFCTRIERVLNRGKNLWSARSEVVHSHRLLVLHRLITPAHCYRIFLKMTGTDLNWERQGFLNPIPILDAASEIAPINFSLDRNIIEKFFRTQLRNKSVARF